MIDFHCHLDLYPDPSSIISGCKARGTYVLAVTTTPRAWEGNLALVGNTPRIRVAPGLHPELVPERHSELPLLLQLLRQSPYVGEVGIDGGPKLRDHLSLQENVFRRTLSECAQLGGRVLRIHSRGAATGVLDSIESCRGAGVPILHWFSGSPSELSRAIDLGCWFSVGPGMLKSKKGFQLAQRMPRDRVLTESDAPFVQDRGEPLMPWDVVSAERQLELCWQLPAPDVRAQLLQNLKTLTETAKSFAVSSGG